MRAADLYASVTQRIITELKEGVAPWARPWKDGTRGLTTLPANAVSGRMYSGINVLILYMEAMDKGYSSHGWCTFQQANSIGATVRKGERSTQVVFVKRVEKEEDGEVKKSTVMKPYAVFNLAQLDKVPPQYLEALAPVDQEIAHDQALVLQKNAGVRIMHGGNKAAYYPQRDEIVLPPFGNFVDEAAYWGVSNHELIHATGHQSRIDRKLNSKFGKNGYAHEELIAEIGSAFLCARLGIPATFRSAAYIANWLEVLGNDNTAVFNAASHASQAANWLWEAAFYAENDETPDVERQTPRQRSEKEMGDAIPF